MNDKKYMEAVRITRGVYTNPITIKWETTSIDDPNEVINMWTEIVQNLQKRDNNPFKNNIVEIRYAAWNIEDYRNEDYYECLVNEFVKLNPEGVIIRSTKGRMNSLLV